MKAFLILEMERDIPDDCDDGWEYDAVRDITLIAEEAGWVIKRCDY